MRWYEYRTQVDEVHAPEELKAKLLAMQPAAAQAAPAPRKKAVRFPLKRVLSAAACVAVGFAGCGALLTGANLTGFGLAGAGQSAASTASYAMAKAAMPDTASYSLESSNSFDVDAGTLTAGEAAAAGGETSGTLTEAKIIYTASLTLETKDYDTARAALDTALADAGGYKESSYESTDPGAARSLSLTLRVPEANYQSFLDAAAAAGSLVDKSEQAEDVTTQYMDVEARLQNLTAQRTRLQELQAQAETLADLLEIESSLSDVQYQIESWQSQLDWYDQQVSCCTVYVALNEVDAYSAPSQSFGEQLRAALGGGWQNFVAGAQQLVIWVAGAWPAAVLVLVAAVAVVWFRRRARRK